MQIWLRHPIHGVKCASAEEEAKADRLNGWVDCPPYGRGIVPPVEAKVATVKTPAERYEEKFGKPPHHRMKAETIEAALK